MPKGVYQRKRRPLTDRFWEKVDKRGPNECWEWTAGKTTAGYGVINSGDANGTIVGAHRISWELAYDHIPKGMCVLHHCDNPGCVNPYHLFLGTDADNVHDMTEKERQSRGESHGNSKLSERNVRKARRLIKEGWEQQRIAELLGVGSPTISMIKTGKVWGWLT